MSSDVDSEPFERACDYCIQSDTIEGDAEKASALSCVVIGGGWVNKTQPSSLQFLGRVDL